MTWPSSDVSNTNVSSGTTPGAPAAARLSFKDLIDKFNQLINHVSSLGQTLLNQSTPALMRIDLGVAPRATRIDVATVAGVVDLTTAAPDTDDVRFTGTNTPTSFVIAAGRVIRATAGGAFTLPNNAAIVTNTGANITLAAGDTFSLRATAANVVEVLGSVQVPLASETVAGKIRNSTSAENIAGTLQGVAVDPLGIREALNSSGLAPIYACRAWVNFNGTGTPAIRTSGNVSSITDNGIGDYSINFATALPDANYVMAQGLSSDGNVPVANFGGTGGSNTASLARVVVNNGAGGVMDRTVVSLSFFR